MIGKQEAKPVVVYKPATGDCNNFVLKIKGETYACIHTEEAAISAAKDYSKKSKQDVLVYEYLGTAKYEGE